MIVSTASVRALKMAEGRETRSKTNARESAEKKDRNNSVVDRKDQSDVEDERVVCFCGDTREFGEMACCEMCFCWFHFKCLGFREGVGLLEKRDFVCCFCMASKTLSLVSDVKSLREEVKELRVRCAVGDEVDNTPTRTRNAGPDEGQTSREATPSYSMVVESREKHPEKKTRTGQKREVPKSVDRKKTIVEPKKTDTAEKKKISPPRRVKDYVGRRKLWGTKRVDTEEDVKKFLVCRVPEAAPVEVRRVCKSEDGRVRWWFWLMGDESVLNLVDGGDFGEFWKVEKKSPFLESVVVRVLGR